MDHKKYLAQIGARGGSVKSERKAAASRANGRKRRHKCKGCGNLMTMESDYCGACIYPTQ